MSRKVKINAADRDFFRKVSEAAFTNPFGEDRNILDLKIAGSREEKNRQDLISRVIRKVADRVRGLDSEGKADIRAYEGNDLELVQTVFLFDIFHRHINDFDSLIREQLRTGDAPCPVPFAGDGLSALTRRGFSDEKALRFFAIFYQLRRAFYFINTSLIGQSPSMRTLRMHLWNSVFTHNIRWYDTYLWDRMEDFSTLLLGETGAGKGTVAASIGRSGFIPFDPRKGCFAGSFTRNFISLNLSQYHEALIESELFGHKKGSFTGAVENHEGIFSRCTPHGSIFLDEIGDISIPIQIKLLQILQERTFSPVGSHAKLRFHGRVIAATNRPLDRLMEQGKFRDDFFYRLCSDIITVPTLRQRIQEDPEELNVLLSHLIERLIGHPNEEVVSFVREAINRDLGRNYHWRGNVRELEQAIRRILLTRNYRGNVRTEKPDLRERLLKGLDTGSLDADAVVRAYCCLLYQRHFTYEEVARRTGLDRRTVKKYILMEEAGNS
ncbi:MAG: sigma 54-interacting transcriptional regulator [Nitrospirota bacterium]|nr:sigma 54-interacting transcriptional regulator [Nitrospirota bacterium]